MTDQQLYLAIGVPVVANAIGFMLMSGRIGDLHKRIDDINIGLNARFDDLTSGWTIFAPTGPIPAPM